MSDIKLFRTDESTVQELSGQSVALEKSLQTLIEAHLDAFLGIRFLASEYSTGVVHGGRIDTLGLDENGCPCIIEYKRTSNENVINQGLFYLDWLMDHRGEFELLTMKTLGQTEASSIEWSSPRLVCIAGGFTKYDEHAVKQMNRNIELIRYLRFDDDLLLLELVNAVQAVQAKATFDLTSGSSKPREKRVDDVLDSIEGPLRDTYDLLHETCLGLGDDVQIRYTKYYVAFKRLKNFVSVEVRPQAGFLIVGVKVDPDKVRLEEGFTRDVREIGHGGIGQLEIHLRSTADVERALPIIEQSYENS